VPQSTPATHKARFIAAEAAQSTLKVAKDGQLPELHLQDGAAEKKKQKDESQSQSMNPLVLIGIIALSLALCIAMVLVDSGSQSSGGQSAKNYAREKIEAEYFGPTVGEPLKPYEQYLRVAQRAHARNDRRTERNMYRKVLDMLRTEERVESRKSLTGTRPRDEALEKHLIILLGEG
jgi:hypothetical protein